MKRTSSTSALFQHIGSKDFLPGAAAALALSAAMAANRAIVVAQQAQRKAGFGSYGERAHDIERDLIVQVSQLQYNYQREAELSAIIASGQVARDAAETDNDRRAHAVRVGEALVAYTSMTIAVAEASLKIFYIVTALFDHGSKAARGQACTAASLCVAAMHGCMGVARWQMERVEAPPSWHRSMESILHDLDARVAQCADTLISKIRHLGV